MKRNSFTIFIINNIVKLEIINIKFQKNQKRKIHILNSFKYKREKKNHKNLQVTTTFFSREIAFLL